MSMLAEKIAVMRAAMRGDPIQYRHKNGGVWFNTDAPEMVVWDWANFIYRVKPKAPRTLHVGFGEKGGVTQVFFDPGSALFLSSTEKSVQIVRFREVMDE